MHNVSHLQHERLKIKNFLSWITTSLTSNWSSHTTFHTTNTNIFLVFAHSLPSVFKSFVSCHCCTWDILTLTHKIIFHSNLINTSHWNNKFHFTTALFIAVLLVHIHSLCHVRTVSVKYHTSWTTWGTKIFEGKFQRKTALSTFEATLDHKVQENFCFKQGPRRVSLAFVFVLYWQYSAVYNTKMHELALPDSQCFRLA
jgi:hypothetical protein